jgi:PilZ domain
MRRFEYRAARFNTDIALKYVDDRGETSGVCTQVSRDGMEVCLADSPAAGSTGKISFVYGDRTIDIEVRVAHVKQDRCGMKFVYKSERERMMMNDLVDQTRRAKTS